jgi:ribonuclease P protein component
MSCTRREAERDVKVRYTLKKNSDFRRLYAKGKSAATPYLVLYCRKNRLDHNRAGYTVSTKLGHAVVRNRVRRRLREIVRLNAGAVRPGFDLVLVARSRAVGAEYKKLEEWSTLYQAKKNAMESGDRSQETVENLALFGDKAGLFPNKAGLSDG